MVDPDPLVGRQSVLAELTRATAATADRRPRLVLVRGEPGIGKTALLTEVARRAAADGALVLWGQCWDGDGAPAFWPWLQVARAADAPDLPWPSAGADDPTARFELYDGMLRLLTRLGERVPVVILLDDLQWADDGSLALLAFAARHLHGAAVLLVGAYRELEAPPALEGLAAAAEVLPLGGLDRSGVAALVRQVSGAPPVEALIDQVHERTGGNPLFVRELTRLLLAQGGLPERGRPLPMVLDSVREILQRRLARLSTDCAGMLGAAAVAGARISPELLRRLVPAPENLAELLAEAVTARVLVVAPGGAHRFGHDLFREAVYAGLAPADRGRLHAACGAALEELSAAGSPVHPAEAASHFGAAAEAGIPGVGPAAVAWSRWAAEEATARLAPEVARGHYRRALRLLDLTESDDVRARVELLVGLAAAHHRTGDGPAARVAYRQAADLARRAPDVDGLAAAALGLHDLGAPSGLSHGESTALLEEAAAELAPGPRLALVLGALAGDIHHSWDPACSGRAASLAARAVRLARAAGDPAVLARCLLAAHDVRWVPGAAGERLAVVEEIRALAHSVGDAELAAQALLLRATARLERGEPAGRADLTEYCAAVDRLGHARGRWSALSRRAAVALIDGDIAEGRRASAEAAALGRRIGEPDWNSVADSQLWELLRATGERDRYAALGANGPTISGWPPWTALGQVDAGDAEGAARLLAAFDVDRGFRPGHRAASEVWPQAIVAEAVAAAGTTEQRREMYRRLAPLAGTHVVTGGCVAYSGAVDHYLGLLAAALDRHDAAHAHFVAAVAQHRRLGAPAWLERSSRELARLDSDLHEPQLAAEGGTWRVRFAGREVHLPELKGLHDLAVLVAVPGRPVHVTELLGVDGGGGDPVLDATARTAYRSRVTEIEVALAEAHGDADLGRSQQLTVEREALLAELAAATGLGGRDRRLGDATERARKTVTSRIRDALDRIDVAAPELGRHLRATVTTGVWCCYEPGAERTRRAGIGL